jgi:hypothetical protein
VSEECFNDNFLNQVSLMYVKMQNPNKSLMRVFADAVYKKPPQIHQPYEVISIKDAASYEHTDRIYKLKPKSKISNFIRYDKKDYKFVNKPQKSEKINNYRVGLKPKVKQLNKNSIKVNNHLKNHHIMSQPLDYNNYNYYNYDDQYYDYNSIINNLRQ